MINLAAFHLENETTKILGGPESCEKTVSTKTAFTQTKRSAETPFC